MSHGYCSSRSIAAARGRATSCEKARARSATLFRSGKGLGPWRNLRLDEGLRIQVNHSLGLTFYCSGNAAGTPGSGFPCVLNRPVPPICLPPPLSPPCWPCRWRAVRHQRRYYRLGSRVRCAAQRRRLAARGRRLGRPLSRQSRRSRYRYRLCPRAARDRSARPGGRRAGAGLDPQSAQYAAAWRLRPCVGRGRRLQPGARRLGPRAHARTARLAHPQRARRGARPTGPPRRSAETLLGRA